MSWGARRRERSTCQAPALVKLATYAGWRMTWDLIVPLTIDRAFPRMFLLYDRAAGEATVDRGRRVRRISERSRTYSDWRKTWDVLVPSGFPGNRRGHGAFRLRSSSRIRHDLPDRCIRKHPGTLRQLQRIGARPGHHSSRMARMGCWHTSGAVATRHSSFSIRQGPSARVTVVQRLASDLGSPDEWTIHHRRACPGGMCLLYDRTARRD